MRGLAAVLLFLLTVSPVLAQGCREAIARAELGHAIPAGLLAAIGQVESGRRDPATGVVTPWPWAIDVDGDGQFFESKQAAIRGVRAAQADGARSIDVGCMQISLLHHPDAFGSLEQAFDPVANVDWAAGFLRRLFAQTGDWAAAAALYHSATPSLAEDYKRKVLAAWREGPGPGRPALANAWAATLGPPGNVGAFGALRVGFSVPHRVDTGGFGGVGRGLAAYRAVPITIASARRG